MMHYKKHRCPVCSGSGMIHYLGITDPCPVCDGKGYYTEEAVCQTKKQWQELTDTVQFNQSMQNL